MELFEQIKSLVTEMETDTTKFYLKGNSQAGRRTRKSLQELKVLAQKMREEIQAMRTAE
jgi:hypothetical protein